mgnify:CR=1 FL=1
MLAFLMSQFSAQTAKKGPNIPAGAINASVTKLVQKVDSVKFQVNHPTPIFWIHKPRREIEFVMK